MPLLLSNSVHMVMHLNSDDESEVGTDEEQCIPIDKCISLTEKLTKELEERSFIFD
jgi:hypothetical protein